MNNDVEIRLPMAWKCVMMGQMEIRLMVVMIIVDLHQMGYVEFLVDQYNMILITREMQLPEDI